MGTKNNPGEFDCYEKAEPDEPMFVLLARDASAPRVVRAWARFRSEEISKGERPQSDRAMVIEAAQCATRMEQWREANR